MYINNTFTLTDLKKEFIFSEGDNFISICSPVKPFSEQDLKSVRAERIIFYPGNITKIIRVYTFAK